MTLLLFTYALFLAAILIFAIRLVASCERSIREPHPKPTAPSQVASSFKQRTNSDKILYLLALIPALSFAQVLEWNEDPSAEGYKLYWQMVDDCSGETSDFYHSVDVGERPEFDFKRDENFRPGRYYAVKLSSYSDDFESDLSEETVCVRIKAPKSVEEIRLMRGEIKKEGTKNEQNNKNIHNAIFSSSQPGELSRNGDTLVATAPSKRGRFSDFDQRFQRVLGRGSNGKSIKEARSRGTHSNISNAGPGLRLSIREETDDAGTSRREELLLSGDELQDERNDAVRIKPLEPSLRASVGEAPQAPERSNGNRVIWIAIISLLLAVFGLSFRKASS